MSVVAKSRIEREVPSVSLHDAIALGQYEATTTADTNLAEVHRLPVLLRLLSASRPLASLPDLKEIVSEDQEPSDTAPADEWLDDVVQRLEDRAALYSAAGEVEVLAGHLAPHVCRAWSRIPPLSCTQDSTGTPVFDTTDLVQAADATSRRRKLSEVSLGASSDEGNVLDDYNRTGDYGEDEGEATLNESQRSKRRKQSSSQLLGRPVRESLALNRQSSLPLSDQELAAEDSQQTLATMCWKEVAALVSQSLQHPLSSLKLNTAIIALSVDDASILAQASSSTQKNTAMVSVDVSATLCTLFHHTPVLRCEWTSQALCRAGLTQAGELCYRIGANIPATVPSLVRGCLIVAQATSSARTPEQTVDEHNDDNTMSSHENGSTAALSAAIETVELLSSLSAYENGRAATMLRLSPSLKSCAINRLAVSLAVSQGDALHLALVCDSFLCDLPPADYDTMEGLLSQTSGGRDCLVTDALRCIADDLKECLMWKQFPAGRLRWILTAYLRLLVLGRVNPSLDLLSWMTAFQDSGLLGRLPVDIHQILVAIAWIGFSKSLAWPSQDQVIETINLCVNTLRGLLSWHAPFSMRALATWKSVNSQQLGSLLADTWGTQLEPTQTERLVVKNNLLHSCQRLVDLVGVDEIREDNLAGDLHSTSKYLEVRLAQHASSHDQVRKSLLCVLRPPSSKALEYLLSGATLCFIRRASKFLCSDISGKREIPVCLPLELEKLATAVFNELLPRVQPTMEVARLLLNLTYTICFLRDQPDSPFRVVVRNLPLNRLYTFLQEIDAKWVNPAISNHILDGLRRACPELTLQLQIMRALAKFNHVAYNCRAKGWWREVLVGEIRKSAEKSSADTSGEIVEAAFCQSLSGAPWKSLCCGSVSAFLSNGLPLINVEYTKLISDPLCLLKTSVSLWSCAGARRVLFTLLFFLVEVNEAMMISLSRGKEDTAYELSVSRNAVSVRCLLALMSKEPDMRGCVFATGFIRALFARSRGLGAAILREGVMDSEWDWLCLNVPEIMDDAAVYQDLLGRLALSTASQRLGAASGVLRLALMHGRREEALSEALVVAATQHLIANFFIILGPVGLPVNAFENDKGGNSTKACRKAALRMLKTFSLAQGRRQGVRNECLVALQKLSRMCKGEELVGGLPVSIANRQKGFLREMLDGINKALLAIGSSP